MHKCKFQISLLYIIEQNLVIWISQLYFIMISFPCLNKYNRCISLTDFWLLKLIQSEWTKFKQIFEENILFYLLLYTILYYCVLSLTEVNKLS